MRLLRFKLMISTAYVTRWLLTKTDCENALKQHVLLHGDEEPA